MRKEIVYMAEFGENLKRVREERGLTQQTLADYLFVTRQAVSRWEGGSRYPDLMTAKKLSQILKVSLDELVTEKDMVLYVEKNPILESPVSKGIQTALIACAFICYFISSIWSINELGNLLCLNDSGELLLGLIEPLKQFVLTVILGYAILMSVHDNLNPRIASYISVCFFGASFLSGILSAVLMNSGFSRYYIFALAVVNLAVGCFIVKYFCCNRVQSPVAVYMISGLYGMISVGSFALEVRDVMQETYSLYYFYQGVVWCLSGVLLLGLFCYLAHKLYLKRKRAAI